MERTLTGNHIRKTFIDFFTNKHKHIFVPSSSLVPGGDQTLLFTNAGMVQFKDVFLGTDLRPYSRAVNSQKCMRVAGKHNDLDDVGRDDTHHTFFEMLGNWSFGDYYKKEAIAWAWELLTEVWALPKENLRATCFRDEKNEIQQDNEAAEAWLNQPGFKPENVLFFGRKDNFWEMAETGPCGPCSEIHIDRGIKYCDKHDEPGHVCRVNGDCKRFLELWNLVFIQYNRKSPSQLDPLPATHVDTGMGLERIVSVLQDTPSNYRTDLLFPLIVAAQELTGHSDTQRDSNFTPYRVIADHARTAAFLISDGVVPGNTGRNYVCRMIIRRAARFGSKIGLNEPFLAKIAQKVIDLYGSFYPELVRNKTAIVDSISREEHRFQRTVEAGTGKLDTLIQKTLTTGNNVLNGDVCFDLYATFGLPLEITRDIALEHGLNVDEPGFHKAMEEHKISSGAGEIFGEMGGEDVNVYRAILASLHSQNLMTGTGVEYDPYHDLEIEAPVLAIVSKGKSILQAKTGETVEVILPKTCFYVESGGQVSDTGNIISAESGKWEILITDMRKPAAGIIVHVGTVIQGEPTVDDQAIARVNSQRRYDIMRNHTATHLLHAELRSVLGNHARQAGSLVSPDRLRFDFTHSEALTSAQLEQIEAGINQNVLGNYSLKITNKPLQQAMNEGAMALFGEKYSEIVRTITIGAREPFSYELCGGTHVEETGNIGIFLITSEGSIASGIRRIEAVTGRGAYELVQRRFNLLLETGRILESTLDEISQKADNLVNELSINKKNITLLRQQIAQNDFLTKLDRTQNIDNIPVLSEQVENADIDTLRSLADIFRQKFTSGVVVLASIHEEKPVLIAAVSDDLVLKGLRASDLVKYLAIPLGGGGGGRPTFAQAGGKYPEKISSMLESVPDWIREKLA